MTACLGPAHSTCLLDTDGSCSLAGHSGIVVVDSPRSGSFERHTTSVPSATYAERVACAHPDTLVLLAGALEGYGGWCGEAVHTDTREHALDLILMACEDPKQERPTRKETYREGA